MAHADTLNSMVSKPEKRFRLFVYDKREMTVFFFLVATVSLFSFTLGLHFGKRVSPPVAHVAPGVETAIGMEEDVVPNRQELREQGAAAIQVAEDVLSQNLHDEVIRTGLALDSKITTDLPVLDKTKTAGDAAAAEEGGRFTLQVGSHPNEEDARAQVQAISVYGVKPTLQIADLKKKGKWYRVMVGSYGTADEAEAAATRLKSQNVIDHHVVTQKE